MTNKNEWHSCHFCGESVKDGREPSGDRHWLSDCRPDLVEHEIGPLCTWVSKRATPDCDNCKSYEPCSVHIKIPVKGDCYAYQDSSAMNRKDWVWSDEHIHFYDDGPM